MAPEITPKAVSDQTAVGLSAEEVLQMAAGDHDVTVNLSDGTSGPAVISITNSREFTEKVYPKQAMECPPTLTITADFKFASADDRLRGTWTGPITAEGSSSRNPKRIVNSRATLTTGDFSQLPEGAASDYLVFDQHYETALLTGTLVGYTNAAHDRTEHPTSSAKTVASW